MPTTTIKIIDTAGKTISQKKVKTVGVKTEMTVDIDIFLNKHFTDLYRRISVYFEDANGKITKHVRNDKKQFTKEEILNDSGKWFLKKGQTINDHDYYSIYVKHNDIIVIDIDEKEYDYTKLPKYIQDLPYCDGNTKGRHYYCALNKKSDLNWTLAELKLFKDEYGAVDIIGLNTKGGNNIWEKRYVDVTNKIQKQIYNYNGIIPVLDFDTHIKPLIKEEKINAYNKIINKNDDKQPIQKEQAIKKVKIIDTKQIINKIQKNRDKTYTEQDFRKLLDLLDIKHWNDYDLWLQKGFIIYNSGYTVDIYDEYSKKSDKYKGYDDVFKTWNSFVPDKKNIVTIGTLIKIVKDENPEEFKKLLISKLDADSLVINPNSYFDFNVLDDLVDEDNKKGNIYFDNFEKSKSFKYFNHYHVHDNVAHVIYKTDIVKNPIVVSNLRDEYLPHLFVNMITETQNGEKLKKHPFVKLWYTNRYHRQITGLYFMPKYNYVPDGDETLQMNLFSGFHLDDMNDRSYDEEIIKPFIDHIKYINHDKKNEYDFLLNLFSFYFQYAYKKSGVICSLFSKTHGSGKTIIFEIIAAMMNKYAAKVADITHVSANFNSEFLNKCFMYCDEINGSRTRLVSDQLKDLATRLQIRICFKGKEAFNLADFTELCVTSNSETAIFIQETDRRYFVQHVPEKKLSEIDGAKLGAYLEDKTKLKHLYNYFMYHRNIKDFNPQRDLPTTQYKKRLLQFDEPIYKKYFRREAPTLAKMDFTQTKILYEHVQTYARFQNKQLDITEYTFSKELKTHFGKYETRYKNVRGYKFPANFENIVNDLLDNPQ